MSDLRREPSQQMAKSNDLRPAQHEGHSWKLFPKKVFLSTGNSHHVTKARVLLCWTLLNFERTNCRWRRKIGYLACRLQPPERPASALFCSAGTGGAVTTGKRSKCDPADWSFNADDGALAAAALHSCLVAQTLPAGTCLYRAEHRTPAATALPVSTMQPDGCARTHVLCARDRCA